MSLLWFKKLSINKTTSSNDKTKVTLQEKKIKKIFGTSDKNQELAPFKICKSFDHSLMSFVWSKEPPFEKTTSSNDKTKVSFTEKKT